MEHNEFFEKLNTPLNLQQRKAVSAIDGPTLLLAVPGSGKTTVLVHRLAYMIWVKGIEPKNVLTLTYTTDATKDMEERFARFFGREYADRLEFRTINGICHKIIGRLKEVTGRSMLNLETDEKKLASWIGAIYREVIGEFPLESDIKAIRTGITYVKNMMLSETEIKLYKDAGVPGDDFLNIYKRYNEELKKNGVMDYDDQLVYALKILKNFPNILAYYQDRYRYILVDEAQDTSRIQHEVIKLLAARDRNIFMVGDEDQSIYGFRAAYPKALLDFEKTYPGAQILYMEENFRSARKIVAAADDFIKGNKDRHKKHMITDTQAEGVVKEIHVGNREEQYSSLFKLSGVIKRQTAVLYRDNECILPLIDMLERQGIPYRLKKSDFTFFTNRVVNDIVNIINFSRDRNNTSLFMQIYYKIALYINKSTAEEACRMSLRYGEDVLIALRYRTEGVSKQIARIDNVIDNFNALSYAKGHEAVDKIMEDLGYRAYLERARISENKIQILRMLGKNCASGTELVHRISELSTITQEKENDRYAKLILSTIHSSKGLEYETVYLLDVWDGLFPEKNVRMIPKPSKDEVAQYEEERRLFYVGATRAKENLFVYTVGRRSSFADELLRIDRNEKTSPVKTVPRVPVYANFKSTVDQHLQKAEGDDYLKYIRSMREGRSVIHVKYGRGEVVERLDEKVKIQFKDKSRVLSLKVTYEGKMMEIVE